MDARWYLRNRERRDEGFLMPKLLYLKELFYELCPAGTHADIYETEDGGRCVLDAGGYIFNSEAHPIDPAALGDYIFYCKDQVLGIRDILVRIRIRGSAHLTKGSGSDFFLQWLLGCKKLIFFLIYYYNLPAGTLSSVLKILFLAKVLC